MTSVLAQADAGGLEAAISAMRSSHILARQMLPNPLYRTKIARIPMKIRTTLLSLAAGAAGLILATPTATAEEETPTPITEVEGITQFETILAGAQKYVDAGEDAERQDAGCSRHGEEAEATRVE